MLARPGSSRASRAPHVRIPSHRRKRKRTAGATAPASAAFSSARFVCCAVAREAMFLMRGELRCGGSQACPDPLEQLLVRLCRINGVDRICEGRLVLHDMEPARLEMGACG